MDITPEIRRKYLLRREAELEIIKQAFLLEDFDTILNVAHKVKGSASTFHFSEIGRIAKLIEEAAGIDDKICLEEQLKKFNSELIRAQGELSS